MHKGISQNIFKLLPYCTLMSCALLQTAHDQGYIVKHLLAGLPSVTERVKAMRQGRNGNNVDDAKNRMFASQEAYIKVLLPFVSQHILACLRVLVLDGTCLSQGTIP